MDGAGEARAPHAVLDRLAGRPRRGSGPWCPWSPRGRARGRSRTSATNSCLPAMRSALSASGCAEQALSASAAPATASPANAARRPGLESTGPIRAALYLRPRAAAPPAVPAPRRRRPRPRPPTRSARAPWPRARPAWRPAGRPGASSHARTRAAIARTAPSSIGNDSQSRACGRHGRRQHRADLLGAGVAGRDGQHAAGRRLGGDHPVGLGEGAREDERLAGGQQRRELVVLQAPGEHDALAQVARRGPVVVVGALEEGQQVAQRRPRAALELAPGPRDRARRRRGRRRPARRAAPAGRRGSRRSRRRRGAPRARAATPPAAGRSPWRR